jgi:ferric-dicitrate binding protein FerR (iron transport regulator)
MNVDEQRLAAPADRMASFALADGSRVWLTPGSAVTMRATLLDRAVRLQGEGTFDVRHERRPFAVTAGDVRVVDRGTLFSVARRDGQTAVILARGAIDIEDSHSGAVIASPHPGQQVALAGDTATISDVDATAALAWREGRLVVQDQPLSAVAARLAELSGTPIALRDPAIGTLRVYGTYRIGDAAQFLDAVAALYPVAWRRTERGMRSTAASAAALGALCVAPALALAPLPASAQVPPDAGGPIVLPAMPLGEALLALARQAGRNILFAASDVAGARAPAIRAADFDSALRRLARSNGLVATRLAGGAVRLQRPAAPVRARAPRRLTALAPLPPRPIEDRTAIVVEAALAARAWGAGDAALRPQDGLASAQIRRLPDRTIAEALGRLPGIVTLATSLEGAMGRVDHAGRATGDFVAMRGLPGTYVETRIDGIEIPQSLPYSRGTQLGLMALAPDMALKVHRVLDARLAGRRSPARWISITSGRLPPRRRGCGWG